MGLCSKKMPNNQQYASLFLFHVDGGLRTKKNGKKCRLVKERKKCPTKEFPMKECVFWATNNQSNKLSDIRKKGAHQTNLRSAPKDFNDFILIERTFYTFLRSHTLSKLNIYDNILNN